MSNFTLSLLIFGYAIWLVFGIIIIRRGFLDKKCGYPMGAICLGMPWEFIFSFIEPQIAVMSFFNRLWLVCDVILLTQLIKYGKSELPVNLPSYLFLPALGLCMVLSFTGIICFTYEFQDLTGTYSAFIIQLIISILFILMLIRRNSVAGQSLYSALLKMIGTLCFDIISYQHRPEAKFLNFIYVASVIFDLIYVIMVYHKCIEKGISPWKRI